MHVGCRPSRQAAVTAPHPPATHRQATANCWRALACNSPGPLTLRDCHSHQLIVSLLGIRGGAGARRRAARCSALGSFTLRHCVGHHHHLLVVHIGQHAARRAARSGGQLHCV